MKVLMVISQFHPIIGGAEKQAQLLAKTLIERGVNVNIVTGWWRFSTPRKEKIDGIRVFRNFSCWGMFGIRGIRILGALIYMMTLGFYLLTHRRAYDIIHVHQALYPAFICALFGKELLHKPVLVKSASSGMTSDIKQLMRFPLGSLQLRCLVKKMDCLVAVNKTSGEEFIEIGYPESRFIHVSNGVKVQPEIKVSYSQVRSILTTSRLSEEKGIDVLLNAWANVLKQEKTVRLVILGGGPLELGLKRLSQSLGIAGSVDFAGEIANVSKFLREADLFVLPSRTEGLSNALLEAMSYGIPCIATHVGGTTEVFEMNRDMRISPGEYVIARNGVLVNPEDSKGLSDAILYLIREGKVREEMGRGGKAFVQENYSIDLIADRYIALYRCMLEGKS